MTSSAVLACATTYEPTPLQISRTVGQLGLLSPRAVLFDNSTTTSIALDVRAACTQHGIRYLGSGANHGTGRALNAFAERAIQDGLDWLVYLDQDSQIDIRFVGQLQESISWANSNAQVALIGSGLLLSAGQETVKDVQPKDRFDRTRFVISSGTAMNVNAIRSVDGFDEAMKLDLVDLEMCLRLRLAGWSLSIDQHRHIRHEIGEGGRPVINGLMVSRHALWRRRLMWRNSVVLARRYGRVRPTEIAKHLIVRMVETMSGAILFRDWRFLRTAIQGTCEGFKDTTRHGLSGPTAEPHA